MNIRHATSADLPGLVALDALCFDQPERWGPAAWAPELDGTGLVLVAEDADQQDCCAYTTITSAAVFHVAGSAAELYRVMTAPEHRGLGIATLLLTRGMAWARQAGAVEMLLEVRLDNRARSLYADAGFTPAYERTNYYGPGLHALVMRRDLRLREDAP